MCCCRALGARNMKKDEKKCNAIANDGNRCTKPKLKWSRYCWWHQDRISLGIILTICGILITLIIFYTQERYPVLHAKCDVIKNGDPCTIECTVINSGRAEAKDVILSFNNMFPLQTRIFAESELGITITEAAILPNPQFYPNLANSQRAFIVKIPRITPKDPIKFRISTTHPDNQRAGKQIIRIRKEIKNILNEFGNRLKKEYPQEAEKWDINHVINARIKEENFFLPAKVSYEKGRVDIEYFSEEEKIAKSINQDLYSKHKKEFIDVYQDRQEFKAPVICFKATNGEGALAIFPPYVDTYVLQWKVAEKKTTEKYHEILLYPKVPQEY